MLQLRHMGGTGKRIVQSNLHQFSDASVTIYRSIHLPTRYGMHAIQGLSLIHFLSGRGVDPARLRVCVCVCVCARARARVLVGAHS